MFKKTFLTKKKYFIDFYYTKTDIGLKDSTEQGVSNEINLEPVSNINKSKLSIKIISKKRCLTIEDEVYDPTNISIPVSSMNNQLDGLNVSLEDNLVTVSKITLVCPNEVANEVVGNEKFKLIKLDQQALQDKQIDQSLKFRDKCGWCFELFDEKLTLLDKQKHVDSCEFRVTNSCAYCSRSLLNLNEYNRKTHVENCRIKKLKRKNSDQTEKFNKKCKLILITYTTCSFKILAFHIYF